VGGASNVVSSHSHPCPVELILDDTYILYLTVAKHMYVVYSDTQ
jgi:hypothetical protein